MEEGINSSTRETLNKILNTLLPFAQDHLAKNGEFYPFAASVTKEDKIELNMAYEENEHPKSKDLIDLLILGFKQDADKGELKAVGICYDVRFKTPVEDKYNDGIGFLLEHEKGESLMVYVPYLKSNSGEVLYGTTFAEMKTRNFFPQ